MTHLKIELNNGIIEEVSTGTIEKLYNTVHDGQLDNTSNLIGRLHTSATYQDYIDYLEDAFKVNGVKLLIIDATKKYIYFVDPTVASYWANSTYGDGTGIDITAASGVLNIPNNAFKSNTSILTFNELGRYFPNCTAINYYGFLGTSNLTSIDLSNITTIGERAFDSSGLSGIINLPKVNNLENGCFALTKDITEINIGSDLNDSNRITVINMNIFNHSGQDDNLLQKVTGLNKVLKIRNNAFYNCRQLLSIDTTSELTTIEYDAFNTCVSLECIDISNVTSIGDRALVYCCSLVDLATNDPTLINTGAATYTLNWSTVPMRVFAGDPLNNKSFIFPNATLIKLSAFNSTKIVLINIPNVTLIETQAFNECNTLTTVTGSNLKTINLQAFKNCSALTSIDLSNVTSISNSAFENCSTLTSINLSNITSIGENTFYNCSLLTSVGDLSNCTSIGGSAFLNCSSLTTIGTLNSSLTSIPYSCFRNCTSLTTFDFSNITSVGSNAFNSCTSLGTGQTLDLNLSNLTSYPECALRGTNYSKLILHCPLLTGTMDTRYPVWYGMPNVTCIDLSDFLIAKNVFNNSLYMCPGPEEDTSIVTFVYPSNVTDIGTTLIYGRLYNTYRYAIILATTPPNIHTTDHNNPPSTWFMNSNLHIYVPDSAKAAYLADTDWASIGGYNGSDTIVDRLHGLSELPNGVWTTGRASLYLSPSLLVTS